MVVVLLCITAAASSAVGLVYRVTGEPIAVAKLQKKAAALSQVLPEFDNTPADEMQTIATDDGGIYVYTARKGGEAVGYAVESFTSGFSGPIKIMVGFLPDGTIRNIQVLEQTETPGLGAKLAEEGNPVQAGFLGRNPSDLNMSVRKDGGDIDAITASTISSRAYVLAVSRAYTAFLEASGADSSGWDASSGATTQPGDGAGSAASIAVDANTVSGATADDTDNAASSGAIAQVDEMPADNKLKR